MFEEDESKRIPDEYERKEICKIVEDNFDDIYKASEELQQEYKDKTSNKIALDSIWCSLTGYEYEDADKIDNPIFKLMKMMNVNPFKLDDGLISKILGECERNDKKYLNATALFCFCIAEEDLCENKDLQKKILKLRDKTDEWYASNGTTFYKNYALYKAIFKKYTNEKYEDTIWKKKIYDEIAEIEKMPLPEK